MRGAQVGLSLMIGVGTLVSTPAFAAAGCYDYATDPSKLTDLEADATRGALSQDTKDCLEQNYKSATLQTTKGKISRVLLVNAYAYDTDTWAKLVQRHLYEVDRSDPNIAYLYAFYLYNREQPDYEAVTKWCDLALERRTEWTGDVLVGRVYQLERTKTYAAYQEWRDAEEAQKPENETEDLRNQAKTVAREWMDFSKSAGKDAKEAEELCISAASRPACGLD